MPRDHYYTQIERDLADISNLTFEGLIPTTLIDYGLDRTFSSASDPSDPSGLIDLKYHSDQTGRLEQVSQSTSPSEYSTIHR